MISVEDLATPRAEGKVVLAMTSSYSGVCNFQESFSKLSRMTGLSDPALAKALKKLMKLRVLERTPAGKYTLRPEQRERLLTYLKPFYSRYFLEMARLVAKGLAKFEGVLAVILFGSAAQGKSTHESDIDLLIVTEREDESLEERINMFFLEQGIDLPFQRVFMSLEALKFIMEREHSFLFGLAEGFKCLHDRAGICPLLAAKEKKIRKRYSYLPEVSMWLLKK